MSSPRAQDPAEGSRATINHELARASATRAAPRAEDVKRLLGPLDPAQCAAILALNPAFSDLEQAAAWADGDGDRAGLTLDGKAAAIFDLLEREPEER
jgi:hypothetical protein